MPETKTYRDTPVSFVRRGGRLTSGQDRAFNTLSDHYLIQVPRSHAVTSVDPAATWNPTQEYGRVAPLIVEIGSGQGHALVAAAGRHPEWDFLGIEVFMAGIARAMGESDRAGIKNLRLMEANAPEVLQTYLPEASVAQMWIFFPDPWHKKRHTKRRMIRPDFLPAVARVLAPGGLLRLATDWEDYALQMRRVLDEDQLFVRDFSGEWAPRFDGRVMTAFERKGLAKGREIRDLVYRRPPSAGSLVSGTR